MKRIRTTRRRPRLLAVSIAACAALVTFAPPSAAARDFKKCRDIDTHRVWRIRADGTGCRGALEIARRYDRKIMRGGHFPGTEPIAVKDYSCKADPTGEEAYKVRCRDAGALVKFNWGV